MQEKLLALSLLIVVSGGCYAMEDSDSSSESSESLPAADIRASDILVNIKNLDAIAFVKKSFAMGGIHAFLRGGFAQKPHDIQTDYKFIKTNRDAIALCRCIEQFEKSYPVKREIFIPKHGQGGYIRFTAQAPFSLRNASKILMKSGYITAVITDTIATRVSQFGELMETGVPRPVVPFIVRANAYFKRTDFLLSIESAVGAQWITQMLDQNNGNVSQWRRNNCRALDLIETEEWFRKRSSFEALCRAIEKVTRRFNAARSVIKIPGHDGVFLKLTMPQQEIVDEVTGILARSPYITQVVIDDCDGYIARRQREIAAQPRPAPSSAPSFSDLSSERQLHDLARRFAEQIARAGESSAAGASAGVPPRSQATGPDAQQMRDIDRIINEMSREGRLGNNPPSAESQGPSSVQCAQQ